MAEVFDAQNSDHRQLRRSAQISLNCLLHGRRRSLAGAPAAIVKFMTKLLKHEKVKPLLSDEHFSVDGTLIEAWASHKSFKPKQAKTDDDGSNFHGQLRKNDTHQSMTDPEAKLYRKADGREAKLSYLGHALMENRNGLAVGGTGA